MLKVFFFGTPDIAVPSLEALHIDSQVEIVGVGVFPDRPTGRKQVLTPCAVKLAALDLELPIYEIPNKKTLEAITDQVEYDLGIVIAFGLIFPESVLKIPTVNVHFSLLPAYRGASPVQSAILDGHDTSGITWQHMVKALDAGDVLWQKDYDITGKSTRQLWDYFAEETAADFPDFITAYVAGNIKPEPQDEAEATFCSKFTRSDGEVSLDSETAQDIYRKYLAFDPWPGIFMHLKNTRIKILKCHLEPSEATMPLPCAENTLLHLKEIQRAGKKPQAASGIAPELVIADS